MIQNKNFEEKLLHQIKDQHLHPKPRWQFLLKDYVIWGAGVISLALGAAATAPIFYMLRYNDLGVLDRTGSTASERLLLIIPIFWLICLGIFVAIVFYNFKHTRKGYRYSPYAILAAVISASVLLGGVLDFMGYGQKVDDLMGENAPFYDQLINPRVNFWSRPGEGRLIGIIKSRNDSDELILIDKGRQEWQVFFHDARRAPDLDLQVGQPARFLGSIQTDHKFKATDILPMMPGRRFFNRFGPMMPDNQQMMRCLDGKVQNGKTKDFFDQYPEAKQAFVIGLLENKDKIKSVIKDNPEFMNRLQNLNIDPAAIQKLQQ